jgi:hypothetical protein
MNQLNLTDEVRAALARIAAERGEDPPPPPTGQMRYHIAVEDTLLTGTAPAATVAAALRGLADQLEQKENHA